MSADGHLAVARKVLELEARGISKTCEGLDAGFASAVELLLRAKGKAVLTGFGKSGHIARKIAATLASTGTPAFFVHPAEAGHGDLGMVASGDVVVMLSNSGTTAELGQVAAHARRLDIPVVLLTGGPDSPLANAAEAVIAICIDKEACPLNLAPTTSTTAALAVGDALAMALLEARGFTPDDFARTHPDGALGRRLLLRVADLMYTGDAIPSVAPAASVAEAIVEMSGKRLGMTLVVAAGGRLAGIFTDGDLRRCLEGGGDIGATGVSAVMHASPRVIEPGQLAAEAIAQMEQAKITHLPVVDADQVVGVIDIHKLVQQRLA